jgi:hypothetical protein
MENVAPCLSTSGDCSGALFDRTKLAFTQICAVGFGDAGSLDGDVLTLLSEQAGGIYMQNPRPARRMISRSSLSWVMVS